MQSALELEVSILEALLRRNRPSHGRTRYHQRLSMLLRCANNNNKCKLLRMEERLQSLSRDWNEYQKGAGHHATSDDCWTLQESDPASAPPPLQKLRHEWYHLYQTVTQALPELLSRVEHAALALQVEMARGFFLPLCTVALGAISRVRVIVMRLGRECLTTLRGDLLLLMIETHTATHPTTDNGEFHKASSLSLSSSSSLVLSKDAWDEAMRVFVEVGGEEQSSIAKEEREDLFWRQLGLEKPVSTLSSSTTTTPTPTMRLDGADTTTSLNDSTPKEDDTWMFRNSTRPMEQEKQQLRKANVVHEDHDMGRSVDGDLNRQEHGENEVGRVAGSQHVSDTSLAVQDVDRNAQVLESVQKASSQRPAKRSRGHHDEGEEELQRDE